MERTGNSVNIPKAICVSLPTHTVPIIFQQVWNSSWNESLTKRPLPAADVFILIFHNHFGSDLTLFHRHISLWIPRIALSWYVLCPASVLVFMLVWNIGPTLALLWPDLSQFWAGAEPWRHVTHTDSVPSGKDTVGSYSGFVRRSFNLISNPPRQLFLAFQSNIFCSAKSKDNHCLLE